MNPTDNDIIMVGIDMLDVVELAEICEYLSEWIRQAPPAVTCHLARFGAHPDAPAFLLEALDRFAGSLMRLVPSVSPTLPNQEIPLGPGEALGLAELLTDLAERGWPGDPDHSQALKTDCRRWAARLTWIPGVIG